MKELLKVENLNSYYGNIHAIRDINLEIFEGEIITLIGSNGAGKTTTLNSLSGLISQKNGRIIFNDRDISKFTAHQIAALGFILCPEGRQVFTDMSILENLKMGAYIRKNKNEVENDLNFVYELFPILKDRKNQSAQTLSGGEQQMLAIARSYMSKPKLLMLDEPSLGIAPIVVKKIFEAIKEISRQGTTILLVEQNATLALEHSHRAYVLASGEISLQGTSSDLLSNPEIKKAYLGS